jgi:hypothetical protein
MYIILKNQRCFFIMFFFRGEIDARYTLCVRYTLCAGRPSLVVKSGLPDDFTQNYFPLNPSGFFWVCR